MAYRRRKDFKDALNMAADARTVKRQKKKGDETMKKIQ